jgi:acyl-CoA synthetase (AMP-forming)/AMP-acid ligase II
MAAAIGVSIEVGGTPRCCSSCRSRAARPRAIRYSRTSRSILRNGNCRDDVVIVDAIPLTATGKINKRALRERYRDYLMQRSAV